MMAEILTESDTPLSELKVVVEVHTIKHYGKMSFIYPYESIDTYSYLIKPISLTKE